MRKILALLMTVGLLLCLIGCNTAGAISEAAITEVNSKEFASSGSDISDVNADREESMSQAEHVKTTSATPERAEYTNVIPEQYFGESGQQGQVVRVEYGSFDYTGPADKGITKPAYVYLPYGYDENDTETKYDILYLMHGWGMTADNFFRQSDVANILDNMIEKGDIPPVIVVSATFDAENQPQDFSRSVNEIAKFHNDFRNDLTVYIEGRFHTYAGGTTEADFQNSREHRAFAGFSLGAVTTWYQFIYNLDYIKYFAPMSGDCWILGTYGGLNQPAETTEYLENTVRDGGWKEDDFFIYSGIGTNDPIWDQVDSQMREMLKSTVFTPKNLRHAIKENGRHDIDACEEYLYNALPIFFGKA